MQSLLQYRRFGRHVKAQWERDQEKARTLSPNGNDISANTSPSSPATEATRLETAEQSSGEKSAPLQDVGSAANPVPTDEVFHGAETGETPLSRQSTTQQSIGTALGEALTGINVRRRRTKEGGGQGDVFVVGYEGENDHLNPHNWSRLTKIAAT